MLNTQLSLKKYFSHIDKKMPRKVLILCHGYGTPFFESCNQYAKLFQPDNVTLAFLTGPPSDAIIAKAHAKNVVFFNAAKKKLRGLKIGLVWQLFTFCKTNQFDTVICHRYKPTYLMLWVAQFYSFHNILFVMHAFETAKALPRKLLIRALFKKNMHFIGVSTALQQELSRHLWRIPKDRILSFPNIIDHESVSQQQLTRAQARQALNIADTDFVFVNIARLVKEKDQKTLIDAFMKFHASCKQAKLFIIGSGKKENDLKQQVHDLSLQTAVIFTGFLPQANRYLKAFDVFVLSSIEEAFGVVLIEAMCARLPLIATAVDGIPEVVGEHDILIEPANVDALANAMLQVHSLQPAQRVEWGNKGYEHMLTTFTFPAFQKSFWETLSMEWTPHEISLRNNI